jgi:hypothetical protein
MFGNFFRSKSHSLNKRKNIKGWELRWKGRQLILKTLKVSKELQDFECTRKKWTEAFFPYLLHFLTILQQQYLHRLSHIFKTSKANRKTVGSAPFLYSP